MSSIVSAVLTSVVLCFASVGCAGPHGHANGSPPKLSAERPRVVETPRSPRRPVRVQLLSCELVEPLTFEETLPDGRVVDSVSGHGRATVRLHVQLDSLTDQLLLVAICNGALAIVPEHSPKPLCSASGLDDWLPLPPWGSLLVYPTLDRPISSEGIVTETLSPNPGLAHSVDWPWFGRNPVFVELSSAACAL